MANFDDIIKMAQLSQNIHKSFGLNAQVIEMLKAQARVSRSYSGLNMMSEIVKGLKSQTIIANPPFTTIGAITKSMSLQTKFGIPQTTIDAISSINRQHAQLFGGISAMTDALRIKSPAIAQINNLHFALSGISGQMAAIAAQQKNWTILNDFDQVTEQAIEFTETLTEEIDEEQKRQFQILMTLVIAFLNKHKALGISALLIIDIFLRFAAFHQYYDFLKEKPDLATKTEISQISIKQDSILHFIQEVNEQLRQAKEYRITMRTCEVKLKPKNKTIIITKLPKDFEVIVIQIQHKWVLVSYFDPNDNLPQTGWIRKKYLGRP